MDNESLVVLACSGNVEAMKSLYSDNLGIIRKICRAVAVDEFEFDDLIQESYFALCNAVIHYRPEKGFKFISYFTIALKRHIWRYIKLSRCKESLTLNVPINHESELQLIDTIQDHSLPDPDKIITVKDIRQKLTSVCRKIDRTQTEILYLYYFKQQTIYEIAESISLTVSDVQRQKRSALEKMRRDRRLLAYFWEWFYEERLSDAYKHTGLSSFRQTYTSSTESTALNLIHVESRFKEQFH